VAPPQPRAVLERAMSLTTTTASRRRGRKLDNGGDAARRGRTGEAERQHELDEAGRKGRALERPPFLVIISSSNRLDFLFDCVKKHVLEK
jgi:hypothetical protein